MIPTPEEVEALAEELGRAAPRWWSDRERAARWILTRFVRREEAEGRKHLDLLLEDNARLRAELRTQRCDGGEQAASGTPDSQLGGSIPPAKLIAENAKLRERVGKLAHALRGIMPYAHRGAAMCDVYTSEQPEFVAVRAALAALVEEPKS